MAADAHAVRAWRLLPGTRERIVRFGDEALVFNPLTWETHLLNPAATLILEALGESAVSALELAGRVTEAAPSEEELAQVASLLEQVVSLGLVVEDRAG